VKLAFALVKYGTAVSETRVEHMFPSVRTLARAIGRSHRQTQRLLRQLETRELLIRRTSGCGHAAPDRNPRGGATTLYDLDLEPVPAHVPPPESTRPGCNGRDVSPSLQGRHVRQGRGDMRDRGGVTCVSPDLLSTSVQVPIEQAAAPRARTAAAPLRSRADEKAREPNGNNEKVIEKLAFVILKTALELGNELSESDFIELVKSEAARLRIDYGDHPDVSLRVVHNACERARHWESWARAAGRLPRRRSPAAAREVPS
jgi:hypothetical protein